MDSCFDMPLYYTIRDTIGKDGSAREIGKRFAEDNKYPDAGKMVTLLDNHDFERFMNNTNNSRGEDKLKLGMDLIMTCRGIPSVYYGDETAMVGGGDPDNRRDMEFGTKPHITEHLQKLTSTRAAISFLTSAQNFCQNWWSTCLIASKRIPSAPVSLTHQRVLSNKYL